MMLPTNNPQILNALKVACKLHAGQEDKAGAPYIFHPYNVALRVIEYFDRYPALSYCANKEECIQAALLHDTIEDTGYTWERLEELFGERVAYTVHLLTKPIGTDFDLKQYYKRIKNSAPALLVKLADLTENMREDRIEHPSQADALRTLRYQEHYNYLMKRFRSLTSFGTKGC